jgi:putative ubiquitin-RnfH superfamily antitoxin RatB of RatAB toxin-antitoxin module
MAGEMLRVELVYATPLRQELVELVVEAGKSVGQVIDESGFYESFPEQRLESADVGVWGRPVDRKYLVCDGDRIEIYRPLQMDPREARRMLAEQGRTMNQVRERG